MKMPAVERAISNEKEADRKGQQPRVGRFVITVIAAAIVTQMIRP
jgi:hypothetical protein